MIPTDILNYRVIRLLGSGGMGSVYLAVNTSIDQQVAIKVLRPEFAHNAGLRAKFKKEAQLLCSLDHPGIVKFLNYVENNDGVFLIMEYVKGITLEDYIKHKNGLIVESKAYPMLREILDAFEYAHSKGIVHQDIKPSNIIIQDDGHIKIMDFGIARIVSEAQQNGAVMGTPEYMSPEQIYGKPVDRRSDVYSLGVLIHNMLTGKAPYDSTKLTEQEIKRRVVKDELPRMIDYYPYVSDKIQKVVDKATQKDPDSRFQNCGEMKSAVKKAIAPDAIPKGWKYGGIAAILVVLIASFLTWDYFRLKVSYYDDYVEVYGVPEGIGRLSNGDVSHREGSYRFEKQKGKVRRVSYVNSQGKLIPHHDSESIDRIVDMTLTYSEGSDKVDTQVFRDQHGKVLYVKDFDSNMKTCTFRLNDDLGTEMTLNSTVDLFESSFDNTSLKGKSKISKYILDFNDKGYISKVQYAGFGNVLVPDGQGIFGRSYVYDKDGRVIEEKYLGKDGSPKATQFGLGKKKFTYDGNGNLARIVYLTVDDKPSSDGNNCPVVEIKYDENGNRLSERYYDMDGNPTLRKDNHTAGFLYEYNDKGQCVKLSFLGIDGGHAYVNGASGYVLEYDENGYQNKQSYIDTEGKAALYTENGVALSTMELDNDPTGNVIEYRLLDTHGKLIETSSFARKKCDYDSIGNLLKETYLDEKGNPYMPPKFGYASVKLDYNPQGRVSRLTYLDDNNKPMTLPDVHFCYTTIDYDVRGNISKRAYFDKDGKPIMTNEGISSVEYEYDENGNEKSRQFYNEGGKPCVLNWYCSRVEDSYDDQGNLKSTRYLDTQGKPMTVDGVATYEYEYDSRGNVTKERPLGINGSIADGRYELRYKYDGLDNIIERAYFNNAGTAVACAEGYHKEVNKYNSRNQCTEVEYYGAAGNLVNVGNNKCAVIKREFDARGNKTSETFFDCNGNRGTDYMKVHKYFNQYDKVTNQICHQISFGADGKPIIANDIAAEGKIEYDKRGNMTNLQCLDGYGKKINGKRGWYETRFEYDNFGERTSEAYYSIDGKPIEDNQTGFHKIAYKYNAMRLQESMSYHDTDGKLKNTSAGYAMVKTKYNNQNQRTEIAYYGANGKPINGNGGWHREVYVFKNGKENQCTLYDINGSKVASASKVNGQWVFHEKNVTGFQKEVNWKDVWKAIADECPSPVDDGVSIEAVEISNNKVTVYIKTQSLSQFESNSDLEEAKKMMVDFFRSATGTPSYVEIEIIVTSEESKSNMYIN